MMKTDVFTYTLAFLALASGAQAQQVLQFDAASDFIWYYGAWSAANSAGDTAWTAASRQVPSMVVTMIPGDTSSQFSNIPVPVSHIFGNGENPFVLAAPRKLPARTVLTVTLKNNDSALGYNVYLSLIGIKVFNLGNGATG